MTRSQSRALGTACLAIGLGLVTIHPALAQTTDATGGNLGTFIQNIINLLNNNVIRGLATIAVIVTGIAWMFGHLDLRRAGTVIVGIIVIFGAATIVNLITGSSGLTVRGEPDEAIVEDVLFLACTRPAMILGVPMEAMGINIILTAVAFLAGHSLLYLLAAPALHLVFHAICRSDPNAFRLLWLWAETRGRARNIGLWGGSSPTPLPLRRRTASMEAAHG